MAFFKSIGEAFTFSSSDSKSKKEEAQPSNTTPRLTSAQANPFGNAFGDTGTRTIPIAGGGNASAAAAKPKRASPDATKKRTGSSSGKSSSTASPTTASSRKSASPSSNKAGRRDKSTGGNTDVGGGAGGGQDDEEDGGGGGASLSGGIERALNSMSRSISRSLSFKAKDNHDDPSSSSSPNLPPRKSKSGTTTGTTFNPTGAATFAKFDADHAPKSTQPGKDTSSNNSDHIVPSASDSFTLDARKRSTTFGSTPTATMRQQQLSAAAAGGQQASPADPFAPNANAASSAEASTAAAIAAAAALHGTSRVKYQGTSVIQGNTVHFLVVAVVSGSGGVSDHRCGKSSSSASTATTTTQLQLIGLLDPLGTVRASTKATIDRCDAIRKLLRVRISPREAELSLVTSAAASSFKVSSTLLVDPAQGPMIGAILPYLRRVPGVSAVDGFRVDYWSASDATGTHSAPLFDVEGPIDVDASNSSSSGIAVLRLRCHPLRPQDAALPGGSTTKSDTAAQTVSEARALLQDDFDRELEQQLTKQKVELNQLQAEVKRLQHQLEWKQSEATETATVNRAREDAMMIELSDLRRQLTMRLQAATQTSRVATPIAPQVGDEGSVVGGGGGATVGGVSSGRDGEGGKKTDVESMSRKASDIVSLNNNKQVAADGGRPGGGTPREGSAALPTSHLYSPDDQASVSQRPQTPSYLTHELLESSQKYKTVLSPQPQSQQHGHHPLVVSSPQPRSFGEPAKATTPSATSTTVNNTQKHDALAAVRAKLAQSEQFLKQARQR